MPNHQILAGYAPESGLTPGATASEAGLDGDVSRKSKRKCAELRCECGN